MPAVKDKTMKKVYITVLSALVLTGCGSNSEKKSTSQAAMKPDSVKVETAADTVRKKITLTDSFYQITNLGSFDIIFTEGETCLELVGRKELIDMVKANADGITLTMYMGHENNRDIVTMGRTTGVKAYVSCPRLSIVSACGGGSFYAHGTIHSDNFQCGCLDAGEIHMDTLECTSFRYESRSQGGASLGYVKSTGDIAVISSSDADISVEAETPACLILDTSSSGSITATGNVGTLDINTTKSGKISFSGSYQNKTVTSVIASTVNIANQNAHKSQIHK